MTESIAIKVSKNLNPAGSRLIALHADRFQVKTDFGCPAEFIQLASIEAVSYTHLTLPTIYTV